MLEIALFIGMLGAARYVANSHEKQQRKNRRQGAPGRAAGRRYDRNQASIWRERYQQERRNHGKTKDDKKRAVGQARESQRLHERECDEHSQTVEHYDLGLIKMIKTTWTPKTRMGALLKLVRADINSLRSSRVPRKAQRRGRIR